MYALLIRYASMRHLIATQRSTASRTCLLFLRFFHVYLIQLVTNKEPAKQEKYFEARK